MSAASKESRLVVIGGGVGGYTAAIRAARSGIAVTLVEQDALGGTCLNVGCIPTKSLLHQAHALGLARRLGYAAADAAAHAVDLAGAMTTKNAAVQRLVKGVQMLVSRNRITLVKGTGEFVDARTLRIRESGQLLHADHFIIATGSEPVLPPIPGVELEGVMSSDGALALDSLPGRLLIIGGGVIGAEFAQIFAQFGSAVTVVEQCERMLPEEDEEVVAVLQQCLQRQGVEIIAGASVRAIVRGKGGLVVSVDVGAAPRKIEVDKVLVAVGRRPRQKELMLERAGVEVRGHAIAVDDHCRTAVEQIYAVGDVRGGPLLAHKAAAEGECAVAHILGRPFSMASRAIPRAVYTAPEIACVGPTEAEARRAGIALKVGRFPFAANGKAVAGGETEGFVKVLADGDTGQIVGVAMVGPDVTNLLGEATLAVQMELTLAALAETVHAHPTLAEALMEAAHDALDGGAIHLPPARQGGNMRQAGTPVANTTIT